MTLQRKTFALSEFKVMAGDDDCGEMSGYGSTFGNTDRGGDVVVKGAFEATLPTFLRDGFIAWGHDWNEPVAYPVEAYEDDRGLFLRAKFHSTPKAQECRQIVQERAAAGKSMGLSIGYSIPDMPNATEYRNDGVRLIKAVDLYEVSLVTVPMNPMAMVSDCKSDQPGQPVFTAEDRQLLDELRLWRERSQSMGFGLGLADPNAGAEPSHATEQKEVMAGLEPPAPADDGGGQAPPEPEHDPATQRRRRARALELALALEALALEALA